MGTAAGVQKTRQDDADLVEDQQRDHLDQHRERWMPGRAAATAIRQVCVAAGGGGELLDPDDAQPGDGEDGQGDQPRRQHRGGEEAVVVAGAGLEVNWLWLKLKRKSTAAGITA